MPKGETRVRFATSDLGRVSRLFLMRGSSIRSALGSATKFLRAVDNRKDVWKLSMVTLMNEATTETTTLLPPQASANTTPGVPVNVRYVLIAEAQTLFTNLIIERLYENERLGSWGGERERWTTESGQPRFKDSVVLPDETWMWDGDWTMDAGADADPERWRYAKSWHTPEGQWDKEPSTFSLVRRRRHIRARRKRGDPPQPS